MEEQQTTHNENQQTSFFVEVEPKKKYYTIAFINKKENILFKVFLYLFILIVAFATFFALEIGNALIFIFLTVISFFIYVLLVYFQARRNNRIFFDFMNDLDYEKMEKQVLEVLKNDKVHPETKNYFLMELAVFSRCYSNEKYLEYGKLIKIPRSNNYQMTYDFLPFSNSLTLDELDELYSRLKEKYKKKTRFYKLIQLEYKIQKAVLLGKSEESLEQLFKPLGKTKYNCAVKTYLSAIYYANAHDKEKFQLYYQQFKNNYSTLKVFLEKLDALNQQL